jgi:hypothetical protein
MSELDRDRREALVDLLRTGGGQSVITTTDLDHVPDAIAPGVVRLAVSAGRVVDQIPGGWQAPASRPDPAHRGHEAAPPTQPRVLA